MSKHIDYSLYLVTDRAILGNKSLYTSIETAIQGGVTLIQLREKNISTYDFLNIAKEVKAITNKYHVPLIINDRIDLALAIDADGVHLGLEDMPVPIARKLLGPNKLIGASVNCVAEALKAQKEGADYLGVGAMFPTATKTNTEKVSLDELVQIKTHVHLPIVAIGGINEHNVKPILSSGIDGVAVVSCILGKENPYEAARDLKSLFND